MNDPKQTIILTALITFILSLILFDGITYLSAKNKTPLPNLFSKEIQCHIRSP